MIADSDGTVRIAELQIRNSNQDDQNQILERPVHKMVLLVKKQALVDSTMKEPDSRWFTIFWEPVVDARNQKRHWDGVHE